MSNEEISHAGIVGIEINDEANILRTTAAQVNMKKNKYIFWYMFFVFIRDLCLFIHFLVYNLLRINDLVNSAQSFS